MSNIYSVKATLEKTKSDEQLSKFDFKRCSTSSFNNKEKVKLSSQNSEDNLNQSKTSIGSTKSYKPRKKLTTLAVTKSLSHGSFISKVPSSKSRFMNKDKSRLFVQNTEFI